MSIWFLCAISVCANERAFTPDEEKALYSLWGLKGAQSYAELEDNPIKFWEDTEKKLFEGPERLKNHLEFCHWFAPTIKKHLTEKLSGLESKPWFTGNTIEDMLKVHLQEDSPEFYYALTTCYTLVYDYTCVHITKDAVLEKEGSRLNLEKWCKTQENFRIMLSSAQRDHFKALIPECHETLRWQITPGGLFSFFDSLVARRKGFQLCSISSNPSDWIHFSVHHQQFTLCSGVQDHDVYGHAISAHKLEKALANHNVLAQELFDACCYPEALATGDLMTMSQQVQAWFIQFHEAPSQKDAWDQTNLASLLFPGRSSLSDPGLKDITPFFVNIPSEYNWRKAPLQRAKMKDYEVQGTLLSWRSLYCIQSFRFLPRKDLTDFMLILHKELCYLSEPDFKRIPPIIRANLRDLCTLQGQDEAITTAFSSLTLMSLMQIIQSLCD